MVRIVTDSGCDLPRDIINEYDIKVAPLTVTVSGKSYVETDLSPKEFWKMMKESKELPKTSQPSPGIFAKLFQKITDAGDEPFCITLSSKLSGSYQSATLGNQISGGKATVFDSLAASIAQGIQVLKAARLAAVGKRVDEILQILIKHRDSMKIIIPLYTLENIVKGGRMSKFQGALAKFLNIKVILQGVNGEVKFLKKVRGLNKFKEAVLEIIDGITTNADQIFGISHMDNEEDAEYFKKEMQKRCNAEVLITEMGPTIATYAGLKGMVMSL